MDTINIFINIGISVVSGAAGCGLFVWLGKKWVGNWFAKDLKNYEQQLDLLKMQKHLQFSNVYVQRAEVIREIYKYIARLAAADMAIKGAKFKDKEQEDEVYQQYIKMLFELYYYATDNGIYLPQETYTKLGALTDVIAKETILTREDLDEALTAESIDNLKNVPDYDKASIINELKSEFQGLLGIVEK